MSELLNVDVTATRSGEEDGRVDPGWNCVERVEHDLPQRDGADRSVGLAALFEDASSEAPANVKDVLLAVDVSAFERE